MQNLQNETLVQSADADYLMKAGPSANFMHNEGNTASPEALQAHIQELADLRVKTRGGLSTPWPKALDCSSLSFMGQPYSTPPDGGASLLRLQQQRTHRLVYGNARCHQGSPTDDVNLQPEGCYRKAK